MPAIKKAIFTRYSMHYISVLHGIIFQPVTFYELTYMHVSVSPHSVCTLLFFKTVVDGKIRVIMVNDPAGTRVNGSANTFDYPILSSVNLTCIVKPSPSDPVTYQWNTEGCERRCFPAGKTTQSVSEDDLLAKDAGTITCTATILGAQYTSDELVLHISGKCKFFHKYCGSVNQ